MIVCGFVFDSVVFYCVVCGCLVDVGIVMINLFGDYLSFVCNMKYLNVVFDYCVIVLFEVYDGNCIVIVFLGFVFDVLFV